jgi:hypothetical protein
MTSFLNPNKFCRPEKSRIQPTSWILFCLVAKATIILVLLAARLKATPFQGGGP